MSTTGYGPDADALTAEVQADDAKDRLIEQLRAERDNARAHCRRLNDELATLTRRQLNDAGESARLTRELAEARAAIVALAPDAGTPQYAVVEAMGHRTLIGRISDVTIAGKAMLRLTRLDGHGEHHLAPDSLYMVTPCSEAQARAAASRLWTQLPATVQAAISGGDVLEEEALHNEIARGDAWGDDDDRVRDDHEHGEDGDDDSDVDPI